MFLCCVLCEIRAKVEENERFWASGMIINFHILTFK